MSFTIRLPMMSFRRFRSMPAVLAVLACATVVFVAMALAAPLPESGSASSGVGPHSGNCSTAHVPDQPPVHLGVDAVAFFRFRRCQALRQWVT